VNLAERERIRMSITGRWNNPLNQQKIFKNTRAFTLIELTMVVLLAGLFMSLTIPQFQNAVMKDNLKSSIRRIVRQVGILRNEAIRNNQDYDLRFDLESNRYWVENSGMSELQKAEAREKPISLPEGVRILDIWFADAGKQMTGEIGIRFYRKGYIRPSLIHLSSEDGRKFTLALRPFLGKVKVFEEYRDTFDL
jgi:type II secretory pathway pseudopilin PulG